MVVRVKQQEMIAIVNDIVVNPFNYKDTLLNGVVFELTAREDIMSQDNQGTVLFKKNSAVAKITTGEKAEFTNYCNGICSYVLNKSARNDGLI